MSNDEYFETEFDSEREYGQVDSVSTRTSLELH